MDDKKKKKKDLFWYVFSYSKGDLEKKFGKKHNIPNAALIARRMKETLKTSDPRTDSQRRSSKFSHAQIWWTKKSPLRPSHIPNEIKRSEQNASVPIRFQLS